MFKCLLNAARAARDQKFPRTLPSITCLRTVSTTSAIRRGIIKSRYEAGQGKSIYRRQENAKESTRGDRIINHNNSRELRNPRHHDLPGFKIGAYSRNSSSQFGSKTRKPTDGSAGGTESARNQAMDPPKSPRKRQDRQGTHLDNLKDFTRHGRTRANMNWKRSEPSRGMRSNTAEVEQSYIKPSRESSNTSQRLPEYSTSMGVTLDKPSTGIYTSRSFPDTSTEPHFSEFHSRQDLKTPISIPYTTAASEFLYGTSVVIAALRVARRKLYKLYIYQGLNRDGTNQDKRIERLARSRNLEIEKVGNDGLRLMDKMSSGRPHNGYILEASALPKLPVTAFQQVRGPQGTFNVALDHQSSEDATVNGLESVIKYTTSFPRYPVVLLLDRILDPGNLGAILRSAFFLGIDAVAISKHNGASLTPTALKASAGASETVPIVTLNHPRAFLEDSLSNGWKFYGAVAKATSAKEGQTALSLTDLGTPARDHPCIIGLGGEGEGLNETLQRKADFLLSIEGQGNRLNYVDSLNVSVAAGLLCEAFLRKPMKGWKGGEEKGKETMVQESGAPEKDLF